MWGQCWSNEVVGAGESFAVLIHGAVSRRGLRTALRRASADELTTARWRYQTGGQRWQLARGGAVQHRPVLSRSQPIAVALLRHLGIERAHVVGHSSGGVMALRLALDAPEAVHSLILLEPALMDVPGLERRWAKCSGSGPGCATACQETKRERPTASFGGRSGQTTEPGSTG